MDERSHFEQKGTNTLESAFLRQHSQYDGSKNLNTSVEKLEPLSFCKNCALQGRIPSLIQKWMLELHFALHVVRDSPVMSGSRVELESKYLLINFASHFVENGNPDVLKCNTK